MSMNVFVLHSPGCPGAEPAAREVARALQELGLPAGTISVRVVEDEDAAKAWGMRGSPTVTVNGIDVDERIRNTPTSLHG
jgi:hypothetical protein